MASLLGISIGPVQGFIAAARRTRDLWYGSTLLSDIARAAAVSLQVDGATLVFPAPEALAEKQPVANKILASIEAQDPAALAERARAAAQGVLSARVKALRDTLGGLHDEVDWDLLHEQVADLLEFAAAWATYEPDDYQDGRERVDRLLAGRKALHDFRQPTPRRGLPVSSLDAGRQSVLRRDAKRLRQYFHLKAGEELDGVSLLKRLDQSKRFVSVSRIAIDPLIRRLSQTQPQGLASLRQLAEKLAAEGTADVQRLPEGAESGFHQYQDFPYDTELFYSSGETDDLIADKSTAKQFHDTARALAGRCGIKEMPIYFALLKADGDRMGSAIAGLQSIEGHRQLSQALARFASEARGIVARHSGALVYSGGDDVLAFLPLDRALDCADKLRLAFHQTVGPTTRDGTATMSVGIAIGHAIEPLDELRRWADDAEHAAKDEGPRNALAVSLHTRADPTGTTAVCSWEQEPVQSRWQRWVEWHREDAIPDGAAYELRELAREFESLKQASQANDGLPKDVLKDVLKGEIARILERKRAEHGSTDLAKAVSGEIASRAGDEPESLRRVVDELIIARHLAAVTDIAAGPAATREAAHER